MEYERPQVTLLGPALALTQSGSCAKNVSHTDCSNSSNVGTPTAYEADE